MMSTAVPQRPRSTAEPTVVEKIITSAASLAALITMWTRRRNPRLRRRDSPINRSQCIARKAFTSAATSRRRSGR